MNTIFALYYFSHFGFTFDVTEPFIVYYADIDDDLYQADVEVSVDALGWEPNRGVLNWSNLADLSGDLSVAEKYPGDDGMICFRINSTADESIDIDHTFGGDFGGDITGTMEYEPSNTVPANTEIYILLRYDVGSGSGGTYNMDVDFSRG